MQKLDIYINGAKEHYILDVDNSGVCKAVLIEVEKVIALVKL